MKGRRKKCLWRDPREHPRLNKFLAPIRLPKGWVFQLSFGRNLGSEYFYPSERKENSVWEVLSHLWDTSTSSPKIKVLSFSSEMILLQRCRSDKLSKLMMDEIAALMKKFQEQDEESSSDSDNSLEQVPKHLRFSSNLFFSETFWLSPE